MPDAETKTPSMHAPGDLDFEEFVVVCARMIGIPVHSEWRDPIIANLRVLRGAADLVAGFPLSDEAEAAPVFEA